MTLNPTLSTAETYILLALARRPIHGYGVYEQVAHDSQGQLILATGTVYAALKRLTAEAARLKRLSFLLGQTLADIKTAA